MDGNSVRELRRASHLSQIQLAQKSGVSRTRIQLAESGALQLSDHELQAIRAAVRPGLAKAVRLLCSEFDCGEGSKDPKNRAERNGEDA
jgi:transcriptional regulator with XRE-family HTH domain